MTNVSSSNGLEKHPKLRFPGFEEPWTTSRLRDFADRVTRKNSANETDLPLTISSKDGLVDQISYFNKTVASKDMSGYYLLKNGEFAYNKSYSVGYDFGSIKRLDRYSMGALSTLYICFALKKYNSDFIRTYFDSLKWYKEIYMISAEGARNHGLLNVPTDEFFETQHFLTENADEQEKIARFISLAERRIETQQRLVDNLKKYKRGVMQHIFDGCDKGTDEWTTLNLRDIFKKVNRRNSNGEIKNVVTNSAEYGLIPQRDFFDKDIAVDGNTSNYYIIETGDFVYNPRKSNTAPYGPFNRYTLPDKGIISPLYTCLVLKANINPNYLSWYFKSSAWHRYIYDNGSQGVRHDRVSMTDDLLMGIPVAFPSEDRQNKIAKLLDLIEARLRETQVEHGLLVDLRNTLMQQLFI
ncbi:MAG: restriction endonuclease subunit S [Candidatus Saccharibacteria bacterium]|nr:restriction endonuclease subunit S [Candidatus Saccharibacteria bacterium]